MISLSIAFTFTLMPFTYFLRQSLPIIFSLSHYFIAAISYHYFFHAFRLIFFDDIFIIADISFLQRHALLKRQRCFAADVFAA